MVKPTRHRVVGGVFGIDDASPVVRAADPNEAFKRPHARFVNARSALYALARVLAPARVWLPSFLCSTIVEAFAKAGTTHSFFAVDESLKCTDALWLDQVRPGDIVLRIHYFGFPNNDPILAAAGLRGALIVDDAAQALFSANLHDASQIVVYSLRKFVGVPDGACLVAPLSILRQLPPLQPAPVQWWRVALAAGRQRHAFDSGSDRRDWFNWFQHAERSAPLGFLAMSEYAAARYREGFNYPSIAERRRENYLALAQRLGHIALFPDLPAHSVPIGFPIIVERRADLRTKLFEAGIYPPIHWSIDGVVPPEFEQSHRLSAKIMTLVCDQRYGSADMKRTAAIVTDHLTTT